MTKYNIGDKIWLKPFQVYDFTLPAQRVTIRSTPEFADPGCAFEYSGTGHPEDVDVDSPIDFDGVDIDAERGAWV